MTPVPRTPNRSDNHSRYPLSSPYSGKSPITMPVLLPVQYQYGQQNDTKDSTAFLGGKKLVDLDLISERIDIDSIGSVRSKSGDGKSEGERDEVVNDKSGEENELVGIFNDANYTQKNIDIPCVGSRLKDMPFFTTDKSEKFINNLQGIDKQLKKLNKMNDTIVDFNESIGAYLFGLFQNAWCVNFNENLSNESIEKLNEINSLQSEIDKLREEIDKAKMESSIRKQTQTRRKSLLLRQRQVQGNGSGRERIQGRGSRRGQIQVQKQHDKKVFAKPLIPRKRITDDLQRNEKRQFLKAGSRNPRFKTGNNVNETILRPKLNNNRQRNLDLKFNYATKIETGIEDSITSSNTSISDTSEIETLSNRMVMNNIRFFNRDNKVRNSSEGSSNVGSRKRVKSWEVKHNKPFR